MARDPSRRLRLPQPRLHVRRAPISRRVLAFITDLLILDVIVLAPFQQLLARSGQAYKALLTTSPLPPLLMATSAVIGLLALAYFSLFEYVLGQTPGMLLLGISVEHATLAKAFLRNSYFFPVFPFPLLLLIEPFYLLARKERLLELLTRTRTVQKIYY